MYRVPAWRADTEALLIPRTVSCRVSTTGQLGEKDKKKNVSHPRSSGVGLG